MQFPHGRKFIHTDTSLRKDFFSSLDFEVKLMILVLGATGMGILFSAAPIYFFLDQNYDLFYSLAYSYSPEIVSNLEREHRWISVLLLSTSSFVLAFSAIAGLRIAMKISSPLKVLKNHIKNLSYGKWEQRRLITRENDEFLELIETYNYFYAGLQLATQQEINHLKNIETKDSQSQKILEDLIEKKEGQLGLQPQAKSDSSSKPSLSALPPHAS